MLRGADTGDTGDIRAVKVQIGALRKGCGVRYARLRYVGSSVVLKGENDGGDDSVGRSVGLLVVRIV